MGFRQTSQIVDRFVRFGKRNQVTKFFAARKNLDDTAFVFGNVIAMQLIIGQTGGAKMIVIQYGVFDFRSGQVGCQIRFPNSLWHPHSTDPRVQSFGQPIGIRSNLTAAITRGDHRQDRLVKRTANNFDSTRCNEVGNAVEVFRMVPVQPLHQWTAGMQ